MAYTIALASGKGGVGKTTTATNLALFAVGMKKKVVLVDIDPLSDVASILDIPQSKIDSIPKTLDPEKNYKEYMIKLFDGLELLFPLSKTGHGERQQLYQLLKDHFWEGMKKDFDLII